MKQYLFAVAAIFTAAVSYAEPEIYFEPAPGIVDELSTIKLRCDDLKVIGLEPVGFSEIMVLRNGQPFCGLKPTISYTDVLINLNLRTPTSEPGEYTIVIPEGSFEYEMETGGDPVPNVDTYTLKYTIERKITEGSFLFTTDPEDGTTVETLSRIKLTADADRYKSVSLVDPAAEFKVYKKLSKEPVEVTTATCTGNGLDFTFNLAEPIESRGEYYIIIPAKAFKFVLKGQSAEVLSTEETKLTYTVIPAPKPVVYDLEVYGTNPKEGATVDLSERELVVFVYSEAPTFYTDPDKDYPNVSKNSVVKVSANDGSWEMEAPLKFSTKVSFWAQFPTPRYDGEYTIYVPEGTYGDSEWQTDPNTGVSNKAYSSQFFITGLGTPESITYNLTPTEISPSMEIANNLSIVTVSFTEGIKAKQGTIGTLTCTETRYEQTAEAVETGDGVFTFSFNPAPTEAGTYMFSVVKGAFGDADYIAGNKVGQASQSIGAAWDFNPNYHITRINAVDAESDKYIIFDVTGRRIGTDINSLPAGLYIIDGQKVIKR